MVGNIYFFNIAYSNFKQSKGRPILIIKELENDFLFLPLTSNLSRDGFLLKNTNLKDGYLQKDSVIIVPKISVIDKNLIKSEAKYIATIKPKIFSNIFKLICNKLGYNK